MRSKQDYIVSIAMALADGRPTRTFGKEEIRAARRLLKSAGVAIPRPRGKGTQEQMEFRTVAMARVEQRIKEEAIRFVDSVGIARALYRRSSVDSADYCKHLITCAPAELSKWFIELMDLAGVNQSEMDKYAIPGKAMAFLDMREKFRADLMREAGL